MLDSERPTFANCRECGKLFEREEGKALCIECSATRETNVAEIREAIERRREQFFEDIASDTGLSEEEVRGIIVETPSLRDGVIFQHTCARCGQRDAQSGSDYCLACRLDLYKSLGDAAYEVDADIAEHGPPDEAPETESLLNAMSEKRARTGTSAFNPARRRAK